MKKLTALSAIFLFSACGFTEYKNGAGPGAATQLKSPPPVTQPSITPGTGPASFARVNNEILIPKCLSCHDGSQPSLPNFKSFAALMSSGALNPGDPASSKLYTEVKSGSMPKNGPALSSGEVSLIQDWILAGALEENGVTPAPTPSTAPSPTPVATASGPATFTRVNSEIIQTQCIKCHGAGERISFVDYASVMASKTVAPSKPERSLLLRAIRTGYMPIGAEALSEEQLSLVEDWINAGALDN